MKIYFTCSTAEYDKYRDLYFEIRNIIIQQKHVLTRDWLPHTDILVNNNQRQVRDIKQIYKACVQAIVQADIVIIEDTVSNFSTGHQITLALQYKKPTLVLWQGKKHRHFTQMFIHGIESDYLEVVEYRVNDLATIIRTFINKYDHVHEKNRFHLVLNNKERMYLDWAQYVKAKSRTKVIREVLNKEIDNDKNYNTYLDRMTKRIVV